MISMRRKPPKKAGSDGKGSGEVPSQMDSEVFPYGLQLRLNTEEIDKLPALAGVDVGEYVEIRARARVTSVSSNDVTDSKTGKPKKDRSVSLQIEDMEVADSADRERKAAFNEREADEG